MFKLDWFTILAAIAIAENTIFMIAQGGWLIIVGLIFGGIWLWIAYWDWRHKQEAKILTVNEFNSTFDNAPQPQFIGDVNCENNARSPYLQCAVNPSGECRLCKDYERI